MLKQGKIEFVVGIFTIIALISLCFLIFFVSDVYLFKKGYEIIARFDYVSILDKGAPVRMSGVRVGEVKQVKMFYKEKTRQPVVDVTLYVNNETIIRQNTKVTIQGTTPLSEPHIEIISEGLRDGVPLEPGATIQGVDPIPMDKLVRTANDIAERVREIVSRVGEFTEDEELANAFKQILLNTDTLTKSLNDILSGEKQNIQDAIANFEKSTANLENVLEHIREGKGTAGKIFVSEELYDEILAFVKDLRAHPWKLLAKPKDSKGGKFLGIF